MSVGVNSPLVKRPKLDLSAVDPGSLWGSWSATYLTIPRFKIKAKRGAFKGRRSWRMARKRWVRKLSESHS